MTARDFTITLLGTGTPIPSADRFGPATLVEVAGQRLLFDAGRGATIRLSQLGVAIGSIDTLFLTHFHSDHTSGVPDVWLTGWLPVHFGRRNRPFHVIGPKGAHELMMGLEHAYRQDIAIRIEDEVLPLEGIATVVKEFNEDGVVFAANGVKVTAFEVNHGDAIKPAYGYRIDYQGRSVVLSGDTRYNENVVKYATGVDLLIHEVAACRPEASSEPNIQRIIAHHTTPREAGLVFTRTRPKLAVFTHIVLLPGRHSPPPDIDEIVRETRTSYNGPLEVGEDLMSFDLGSEVEIRRHQ